MRRTPAIVAASCMLAALLLGAFAPGPASGGQTASTTDVDVMYVIDNTGSMSGEIAQAKANAIKISDEIAPKVRSLYTGAVAFRDHPGYSGLYGTSGAPTSHQYEDLNNGFGGEYVFSPLNPDKQVTAKFINDTMAADHGNDLPEAVEDAMYAGVTNTTWRPDAAHIIILIGDAPPHDIFLDVAPYSAATFGSGNCPKGLNWTRGTNSVLEAALSRNVRVFSIQSGYGDKAAEYEFREMANLTKGAYIKMSDASRLAAIIIDSIETGVMYTSVDDISESYQKQGFDELFSRSDPFSSGESKDYFFEVDTSKGYRTLVIIIIWFDSSHGSKDFIITLTDPGGKKMTGAIFAGRPYAIDPSLTLDISSEKSSTKIKTSVSDPKSGSWKASVKANVADTVGTYGGASTKSVGISGGGYFMLTMLLLVGIVAVVGIGAGVAYTRSRRARNAAPAPLVSPPGAAPYPVAATPPPPAAPLPVAPAPAPVAPPAPAAPVVAPSTPPPPPPPPPAPAPLYAPPPPPPPPPPAAAVPLAPAPKAYSCPSCRHQFSVTETARPITVACPGCRTQVTLTE